MDKNNIVADKITTEYININGRKINFTPEQKEEMASALDSPFARKVGEKFYFVGQYMEVDSEVDFGVAKGDMYSKGNYCTDENIMYQHALHIELYNMLWRFSMTHGGGKFDWNDINEHKYMIYYNYKRGTCEITSTYTCIDNNICFADRTIAETAIEEIIKPFMEEHPDFDWAAM